MGNIESPSPHNPNENWGLLSAESKKLLTRQEYLQADRIKAINDGDEHRRRLIEEELDEIAEKLK